MSFLRAVRNQRSTVTSALRSAKPQSAGPSISETEISETGNLVPRSSTKKGARRKERGELVHGSIEGTTLTRTITITNCIM